MKIASTKTQAPALQDKVRDVSNLYEKQFLREMVKAMRGTVQSGGLIKRNQAEKIFQEQLDHEYVEKWGDNGGIGLADLIYQQLNERFMSSPKARLKGPLPVPGAHLEKMEKSESGMRVHLENKSEKPQEIQNPLPGKVDGAFVLPDGKKLIRVSHEGGLRSNFVFSGPVESGLVGRKLSPGETLGVLNPRSGGLFWNMDKTVQS